MVHWLDEYPVLRIMRKQIAADDYNRIRLGLLRHSLPWHVQLNKYPHLHCILDNSRWICIDECRNFLPILAWTRFSTGQRDALDAPIDCELRLYHIHAGLLMGNALADLAETVTGHTSSSHQQQPVTRLWFEKQDEK